MRSILFFIISFLSATGVYATEVTINFTGTVGTVFGSFGGANVNDPIVGFFTYESTTGGIYTAAGNPTFERSEMLYTSAITSVEVMLGGNTLTNSDGNITLLDASEMFAGEDVYKVESELDNGSISFSFMPAYSYTTFTILDGDSLIEPPALDPGINNDFGIVFVDLNDNSKSVTGSIESFDVSAVPIPSAIWLFGSTLMAFFSLSRRANL